MTTMADIRDHVSVDLAMARVLWLSCERLDDDVTVWRDLRIYGLEQESPWTNRQIVQHMDAAIAQARVMRGEGAKQ